MLTDAERALRSWRSAGWLYREIGFGFGHYLLAITGTRGHDTEAITPMASALSQVVAYLGGDAPGLPEPLLYPQQQTYLLLAAATAAAGNRAEDLAGLGRLLVERSPLRSGVAPVGALGTPVRTLWQVADWLLNPSDGGAAGIAEVFLQVTRRYGEAMSLAMVNDYLWSNGAAPVDVGKLRLGVAGDQCPHGVPALRDAGVGAHGDCLARDGQIRA